MSFEPRNATGRRALRRLGASVSGRYTILRLLGVGGMGAVYEGVHRNGHAVAIKILHERLSADPEIERLFRREALLANTVGHAGVLPVIDDDITEDGCVFLVMPLLHGETVRQRASRKGGRLPATEVATIAHAVLLTLTAAHAKKIVHRDIKPENIYVTTDGDVRVLDFGIGRFFATNEATSATRSGNAIGTPAFMAPEQALGRTREVDGRTDLWALGATIFTLLTSQFVHQAETGTEIAVLAATRRARPLAEAAPDVHQSLHELVDRALSFHKEDRWGDADTMARALARASEQAFGCGIADLPPLFVPAEAENDVATQHVPLRGSQARDADRLPLDDAGSRTATAVLSSHRDRSHNDMGRSTLRVRGLALTAATFSAGLLASAFIAKSGLPLRLPHPAPAPTLAAVQDSSADSEIAVGLQLWRDASSSEALRHFEAATHTDPSAARTHLYFVVASEWVDAKVRHHYSQAVTLRDHLSEGERALLPALAPSMDDPPRPAETIALLTALHTAQPSNVDLLLALSVRDLHARLYEDARYHLAEAERVHGAALALARLVEARISLAIGNDSLGRQQLLECVASSPTSRDCLELQATIDANDGRCEASERSSRRLIAAAPDSPEGYALLAAALLGQSDDPAGARAALEQRWTRVPDDYRSWARLQDEVALALFAGNFRAAFPLIDQWSHVGNSLGDAFYSGYPRLVRTRLFLELGENESALSETRSFQRESPAWSPSEFFDPPIEALRIRHFLTAISTSDFAKARDAWFDSQRPPESYFSSPSVKWMEAYAESAATPDDGRAAIARLPAEYPLFPLSQEDAEVEDATGFALLLGGDLQNALPHLERAARACSLAKPLSATRASLHLGLALEEAHEPARACEAYAVVAQRWGNEPRSRSASEARNHANALRCPVFPR